MKEITQSQELRALTFELEYTDTDVQKLFVLPRDAKVVNILVDIETQFNDSGTDLLTIGITGDPDAIVDDLDISAAGGRVPLGTALVQPLYTPTSLNGMVITAQYAGGSGDASAGKANITIVFALKQGTRI